MRTRVYVVSAIVTLAMSMFDHSNMVISLLMGSVFAMVAVSSQQTLMGGWYTLRDKTERMWFRISSAAMMPLGVLLVGIALLLAFLLARAGALSGAVAVMFLSLAAREAYHDHIETKYATPDKGCDLTC